VSIVNDSVRLSVYETDTLGISISFTEAQEICRTCADGELVQGEDTALIHEYLPTWLGVVQDGPVLNATSFRWLNGSEVQTCYNILLQRSSIQKITLLI